MDCFDKYIAIVKECEEAYKDNKNCNLHDVLVKYSYPNHNNYQDIGNKTLTNMIQCVIKSCPFNGYNHEILKILQYPFNDELLDISRLSKLLGYDHADCKTKHSMLLSYTITARSLFEQREQLKQLKASIEESFTKQLQEASIEQAILKRQVDNLTVENSLLKQRIEILDRQVNPIVEYNLEELQKRIEPFKAELLMTARIFQRIIHAHMASE